MIKLIVSFLVISALFYNVSSQVTVVANDAQYQAAISAANYDGVIINLLRSNCYYSKLMKPIFESLAAKYKNFLFVESFFDNYTPSYALLPDLYSGSAFGVPVMAVYKKGIKVDYATAIRTQTDLENMIIKNGGSSTTNSVVSKLSTLAPKTVAPTTVKGKTLVTLPTGCLDAFRKAALLAHNNYRALHSTPALSANSTIDTFSLNYANYLAINNLFVHSTGSNYGENLAGSFSSYAPDLTNCGAFGTKFVNNWYSEISAYSFANPGFSMTTGHFTQVVWKSTTLLGCGLSITTENNVYGVCNYYAPGNYAGQFTTNVLPLKSG